MMKFRSRGSKSSRDGSRGSGSRGKAEYFGGSNNNHQRPHSADIADMSPRSVTTSTHPETETQGSGYGGGGEFLRRSSDQFDNRFDRQIRVPISSDGRIRPVYEAPTQHARTRSLSAHRASQLILNGGGIKILGREEHVAVQDEPQSSPYRRARSQGRPVQRSYSQRQEHQQQQQQVQHIESIDSSEISGSEKKRKSKMEKIRQLQAKNELYKEEFKRVQKDRKRLRKELEAKSDEIASLGKKIDERLTEVSRLKEELSDVLLQLERTDHDAEKDQTTIAQLSDELEKTKDELSQALKRVSDYKNDVSDLREYVRRKDDQIEALTREVSSQEDRIRSLQEENRELSKSVSNGHKDGKIVDELVGENKKLQDELGATLQRAATMVKEREDAIADLLKENDEIKEMLSVREAKDRETTRVTQEDLDQMREELDTVNTSLEQVQDRNVLLEEEIEAWLARGSEMESMLDKLNGDLESWQKKAKDAEDELAGVTKKLTDAKSDCDSTRSALARAEVKHKDAVASLESRHKDQIANMERKHKAAIAEIQERALVERMEKKESSADSQHAMLLQAVAERQRKSSSSSAGGQQRSWRRFLSKGEVEGEEYVEEDLDENQRRIKDLEATKVFQDEEIRQLKSELVRLRSSYNEAMYMSKKKIERLMEENEAYAEKTKALEKAVHDASR